MNRLLFPLLMLPCIGTTSFADDYAKQHASVPPLFYHDDFKEYYPKLSHSYPLDELPLLKPVVVVDNRQTIKATIRQTDTGRIPHGKSLCNVTIEGLDMDPLHVSFKDFRIIRAQWVGSNLLYFDVNVAHIASIECVLDILAKKWIYTKSISFNKFSEMKISVKEPEEPLTEHSE